MHVLLVAMPVTSSFLPLLVLPGATSSFLFLAVLPLAILVASCYY